MGTDNNLHRRHTGRIAIKPMAILFNVEISIIICTININKLYDKHNLFTNF